MQRDEMLADVRERLGERTANFWTDEFIIRHLKQGERQFNSEERWPWLYTLQPNIPVNAGNPNVELIDNVPLNRHFGLRLVRVGDTSGRAIYPKKVEVPQGHRLAERYYQAAEPRWYYLLASVANAYVDGDTATAVIVRLVPTPNEAYLADYVYMREGTGLSGTIAGDAGATSEPRIPESYHEAVIAWCTAQCWLKEKGQDSRKAQEQFALYNSTLEKAEEDLKESAYDDAPMWGGEPVSDEYPITDRQWYNNHLPPTLGA